MHQRHVRLGKLPALVIFFFLAFSCCFQVNGSSSSGHVSDLKRRLVEIRSETSDSRLRSSSEASNYPLFESGRVETFEDLWLEQMRHVEFLRDEADKAVSRMNFQKKEAWWYLFPSEVNCPLAVEIPLFPVSGDGFKMSCNPARYQTPDCLMYSYGVYTFGSSMWDIAIAKHFPNCELHLFDPYPYQSAESLRTAFAPFSNIHYHEWGISGPNNPKPELKSLGEVIEELGHQGRTLTVLKVDVEGAEYLAFPHAFEEASRLGVAIDELLFEVHLPQFKGTLADFKKWFDTFAENGFLRYARSSNYYCPMCMEFAWISEDTFYDELQRKHTWKT